MGARRGFSLVELIVVLAVSVILTGLMLPALSMVRENVNRVVSASNLRQIGFGTIMYDRDFGGALPHSHLLEVRDQPHELMTVHLEDPSQWDGLGHLYAWRYVDSHEVFYNPSHHGLHPVERYQHDWMDPEDKKIVSNYHYGGHLDWLTRKPKRLDSETIVIATDGLRTQMDFSHETGMNILRGDASVRWLEDGANVAGLLPATESDVPAENYRRIWNTIEDNKQY